MAIAFVTGTVVNASAAAGGTATTSGVTTTGASLIIIAASNFASTTYTISDSKSDTYTAITNYVGGSSNSKLFYCLSPTVGSSHTFSGIGSYITIVAISFSGVKTSSALDQQTGAGVVVNQSTIQPGSITPSENNELVVCAVSDRHSTGNLSIDSSFVTSVNSLVNFNPGNYMGCGLAYIIQTTAGAVNPTWTVGSGSPDSASAIASFKSAPTAKLFLPGDLTGIGSGGPFYRNPLN